jgi:hypothetical protein
MSKELQMTSRKSESQPNQPEVVAERRMIARERKTQRDVAIRAFVGLPHWIVDGVEASCSAGVEGLYGPPAEIRGVDPLDALSNATLFVRELLLGRNDEYDLYWADGEPFDGAGASTD